MKSVVTILLGILCMFANGQNARTLVDSSGLIIEDNMGTERLILNGDLNTIDVRINDSLVLRIQGTDPASITLINELSGALIGMEVGSDGSFAIGEFVAPLASTRSILNIQNGLFRPEPNTQALATNNAERLRITPSGDIGIGTLDPIARLDVEGGIRIGLAEDDPTLEHLLVWDPATGLVRARHVLTLPPVNDSLVMAEHELLIRQAARIELLTEKIQSLETRLSGLEATNEEE